MTKPDLTFGRRKFGGWRKAAAMGPETITPRHCPAATARLQKDLGKSRTMTGILARQSDEARAEGEALIRKADNLACQGRNERMWSGGPAVADDRLGQQRRLPRGSRSSVPAARPSPASRFCEISVGHDRNHGHGGPGWNESVSKGS